MGGEEVPADDVPRWLSRLELLLAVTATAVVLAVVIGRLLYPSVAWTSWSDRDLARSLGPLADLPASGAELNRGRGARIPGGAQYVLLRMLGAASGDPARVLRGLIAFDTLGLVALAWATWRVAGRWAGAMAALAYVSAPLVISAVDQVWNPSPVPALASFGLALIVRAVVDGRARALWAWAPVCALGLQHHLSWVPWAGAATVVILLLGPAGRLRALAVGVGLAALLYVPYWLEELALHGRNTLLLTVQPRTSALGGTASFALSAGDVWSLLTWVAGPAGFERPAGAVLGARSVLLGGLVVGGLLALSEPRRAAPRLAASLGVAAMIGVVLVASDRSLLFFSRYVVVFLPALCLAGAAGLAATVSVFGPVVRAGGTVAVTAALVVAARPAIASWTQPAGDGWWVLSADLEAARAWQGGSLADLASRTVLVHGPGREPAWRGFDGVSYLLALEGASSPGSGAPPCVVLLRQRVTPVDAPVELPKIVPLIADRVRVIDTTPLREHLTAIRYDGVDRCPTSMTQRYVDDPEDAPLHALVESPLAPGQVQREQVSGATVWRASLPLPDAAHDGYEDLLYVSVTLVRVGEQWRATLRAPQLSGEAHLRGWFVNALALAPRLLLRPAEGPEVEVAFSTGPVGLRSAVTPLHVDVELPPGPMAVSFRTTLVDVEQAVSTGWPPPADALTVDVELPLESAWTP